MDDNFLSQLGRLTDEEIEFIERFRTATKKQRAGIAKAIDVQIKELEYNEKTALTD